MRDSGLLDVLIENFTSLHDIDVEYVAVGTGAALELGRNGGRGCADRPRPGARSEIYRRGVRR